MKEEGVDDLLSIEGSRAIDVNRRAALSLKHGGRQILPRTWQSHSTSLPSFRVSTSPPAFRHAFHGHVTAGIARFESGSTVFQ
jgi:hypothetical protein